MSKSPYLFFYIIIYIYVLYSLRVCIYIYTPQVAEAERPAAWDSIVL